LSTTETIEEVVFATDNVYKHHVILYNDDVNSFDHVEDCLMTICKKTYDEATRIAWEAHETGKAVCYTGSLEECETVGEALASEGLTVSVH